MDSPTLAAQTSRRTFFAQVIGACVTFLGVLLGIPALGAAIGAALKREESQWLSLGSPDAFHESQPTGVNLTVVRRDGWIESTDVRGVWVVRQPGVYGMDGHVLAGPPPRPLDALSPRLSGFMMEAAQRFGIMWFAAQQGNWDLAAFEGREAKDTLHRGGLKSNQSRQQGMEAFNTALLDPLIQATQAGDQARFEQAYRIAILGCNGCHSTQTYGQTGRPFSFVKIQVPKNSPEDVYAYAP